MPRRTRPGQETPLLNTEDAFVRRRGVNPAALTAGVQRVWGRAAVAMAVAWAAVCVMVPPAQAQSQIAFQTNTGGLWMSSPVNTATDVHAGMASGTNPSINNWGIIAFQANTGNLDVTGRGDLHLGMMAGTSPSIDDGGQVVFQANSGDLWQIGGTSCNCNWHLGMMTTSPSSGSTSPSIGHENVVGAADHAIAFQANTGHLWNLNQPAGENDTGFTMAADTSPSMNDTKQIAFQGSNGDLWTWDPNTLGGGTDLHAAMMPGTSPSINYHGEIAFQANTGHLWTNYDGDTGQTMAAGTSPSINDYGVVAFQGNNRDLWAWNSGPFGGGTDLDVEMMAGTSPSIEPGIAALGGPPPPTASAVRGGSDNDRLNSGSGGDLIRGGQGNDQIYGGPGNDVTHGGPGNDRIYGGRGNDFLYGGRGNDVLYGGPGKNRIVDHRGATTVFAGSGASLVDVADGRGDDRVVCAPGSFTDVFADRGDRTGSCGSEGLPITAGGAAAH